MARRLPLRPLLTLLGCLVASGLSLFGPRTEAKPKAAADSWWSLRPLAVSVPPDVRQPGFEAWARTPVDRFILAKLREKGLEPSPPADKRTLLRRVTFDLTGLPPTKAETD